MQRVRMLGLVGVAFVLSGLFAQAEETDLKALLKKAIAAHGGEKNLTKMTAFTSKFKGKIAINGGNFDVTGEISFQKPNKMKNAMTLDIAGKKIDVITVYDGKKMWVSADGKTKEIDDDKILKDVRMGLLVEGAGGLVQFLKAPYTLSPLGEMKVKGKDAIGVRVSKKGQRDLNLFFDKKTHLVVKTEMNVFDLMTNQEVNQEKIITSYQEQGGLKIAKTLEVLRDGKPFMSMDVTEVQALEKIDDSVFAKP